jgi:hypothetical protein
MAYTYNKEQIIIFRNSCFSRKSQTRLRVDRRLCVVELHDDDARRDRLQDRGAVRLHLDRTDRY